MRWRTFNVSMAGMQRFREFSQRWKMDGFLYIIRVCSNEGLVLKPPSTAALCRLGRERFWRMGTLQTLVVLFLIMGCMPTKSSAVLGSDAEDSLSDLKHPMDRRGFHAEPEDFNGVQFREGRPKSGDSIATALTKSSWRSLQHNLELITKFPVDAQLHVVAFTDDRECAGPDCVSLSQRRAVLLHDWLIHNGVPAERLGAPHGFGASRPIRSNDMPEGRAMNRRGYISYEGY